CSRTTARIPASARHLAATAPVGPAPMIRASACGWLLDMEDSGDLRSGSQSGSSELTVEQGHMPEFFEVGPLVTDQQVYNRAMPNIPAQGDRTIGIDDGLTAYWIVPPSPHGPLGFGVTAWSFDDAV